MESAAWAQAILSAIAIVVSGLIAVMVPYRERQASQKRADRARLDVTATRFPPGGLQLDIRYAPEFTHAALVARIAVKSPGVKLYAGRPVLNPARMATGGYTKFELAGQCIGEVGVVGLSQTHEAGIFRGAMFLIAEGTSGWVLRNAKIDVTIGNAVGEQFLATSLVVSPIEEGPGTVFQEPPPIPVDLVG